MDRLDFKPQVFKGRWGVIVLSEVVATKAVGQDRHKTHNGWVTVFLKNGANMEASPNDRVALEAAIQEFHNV